MQITSQAFESTPAAERPRATWHTARRVRVDDTTELAVWEAGLTEAGVPVVLLVHGLGHWTQAAWDFVAAEFEATHRIVAFDLPGFGDSSKPDVVYDLDYFTRATRAVVETLALRDFALIGHSLGGLLAADYAGKYPGDLRFLALLDPAGFLRTPKLLLRVAGSRLVTGIIGRVRPTRAMVRSTFETGVYDRSSITDAMHARMFELSQDPAVMRTIARVYRDALQAFINLPALHAKFARFKGPVLLVWGRDDRYVPIKALENARRVYPQAEVEIYEHCGHIPNIEFPGRLSARLLAAGA
jgi:pimeloyl-ACP methyl ester carboxylesterase